MKDIFYDLGVLRAFLNSDSFQEAALWMRHFDGHMSNVPRVAFCQTYFVSKPYMSVQLLAESNMCH